ncbi:MAG TPA: hypothetical protein VD788_11265, partial [Candidatus Polarisedimenticolaceae bacterium]|nr:hypothetical protein [Candidatus Polarisedimenticolaceae bacterium]
LAGALDRSGVFVSDPAKKFQAGTVQAKVGALVGEARVRVIGDLPWEFDFDGMQPGRAPQHWVRAGRPWEVREVDGGNVLVKLKRDSGLLRNELFMGPSTMTGYTIQADVRGGKQGRRLTDIGLINNGYTLDLQGNLQKLEVRSWPAERRMAQAIDFAWEPDTWYTMRMRVEITGDKGVIYGKVWPRGAEEPGEWTIRTEDPLPIPTGSAGLIGYSPADIYYDNIKVVVNE